LLHDPSLCSDCGALYHNGRWQWPKTPHGPAETALCEACHRIRDANPAGFVSLRGGFMAAHKDEILGLVRNTEAAEKGEHPLHRIMAIEEQPDEIVVTTTDIHLPRRIGEALFHAYEGDLDFAYEDEAYYLRVTWTRNG
jgi:hypothetical protein